MPWVRPLLNQKYLVFHAAFQAAKLNANAGQIKCASRPNSWREPAKLNANMHLREYLPRKFGVGHGEVISVQGLRSKQMDVVIANDDHPFTYREEEPSLFLVDGVSAVGEVKTVLTKPHLESAIENARRMKALSYWHTKGMTIYTNEADRKRYYSSPPYFLFSFESELSISKISELLNSSEPNVTATPYPSIDALFVLQKGNLINIGSGEGAWKAKSPAGQDLSGWVRKEDGPTLAPLLTWLSVVMPRFNRPNPVILEYLGSKKG